VLVVPCAYFGVRLAGVNGNPALPAGLPAHGTTLVLAGPNGASGRDAHELRSLRAGAAVAAAQISPAADRGQPARRPGEGSETKSPPSSGGGTGGGGGGETNPNLTLPVIGATPIPDPGIEVPELPVDPGTLPSTGDAVPDADALISEPELPLP
jgi:hypothetical protein